jgi:hypothetical protein
MGIKSLVTSYPNVLQAFDKFPLAWQPPFVSFAQLDF